MSIISSCLGLDRTCLTCTHTILGRSTNPPHIVCPFLRFTWSHTHTATALGWLWRSGYGHHLTVHAMSCWVGPSGLNGSMSQLRWIWSRIVTCCIHIHSSILGNQNHPFTNLYHHFAAMIYLYLLFWNVIMNHPLTNSYHWITPVYWKLELYSEVPCA